MANYTIQEFSSFINEGDNVNTLTPSLVIVPNPGYVVDKDDFSCTPPTGVISVAFSNTGTPGEPGNTVGVLVLLGSSSVTNDVLYELDIQGDAVLYDEPLPGSSKSLLDYYVGVENVSSPIQSTITLTSNANSVLSAFENQETIQPGGVKIIGNLTFEATSGYYFSTMPTVKEYSENSTEVYIKPKDIIRDVDGFINKVVYNVYYSSLFNKYIADEVLLKCESIAVIKPSVSNEIKTIDLGAKILSNLGETRYIKVYGNVDSSFDFSIVKNSNSSTVYSQNNINITSDQGVSAGISSKLRFNNTDYDYLEVNFPASTTSEVYNIVISANSGTTLGSNINSGGAYTLNQYANPTFEFYTELGGVNTLLSEFTRVGRPNKTAAQLTHIFKTSDLNFIVLGQFLNSTIRPNLVYGHYMRTFTGEVKANDPGTIYVDDWPFDVLPHFSLADSRSNIIENGVDTTDRNLRVSSTNFSNKTLVVTTQAFGDPGFQVGKNKSFTFVQSNLNTSALVKSINGGTELTVSNLFIEQPTNTNKVVFLFDLSINKFGTTDIDLILDGDELIQ